MHNQPREPQPYEDYQEESIQEFKNVYQATSLQSQYTFTQLLSKVFLNKYNKTFSCDLTWSIVTRCIMKKNLTCSAAALELILASCYIRQYMRLIVHFYSKLTLNHHRVFEITFFCDHMCLYTLWAAVVHYKSSLKNRNPWLCNFSRFWIFNTAQLCGKTATLVRCTLITYEYAQSLFKKSHASRISKCSSYHFVWGNIKFYKTVH